ncbi:MAG: formylglycine-generating enzyme family protein [Phycisphaeraceae bacterium]
MVLFYWLGSDEAWNDRDVTDHPRELASGQINNLPPPRSGWYDRGTRNDRTSDTSRSMFVNRLKCCLFMAAATALVSACGETAETVATWPAPEQTDVPGIVDHLPDDLPKNAQVVPLDDGRFMVPYEAEIPGFGVTYLMTPVPGGTFTMGSPPDEFGRQNDEGPQVQVEVEPFWIGVYPVTWAEYHTYYELAESIWWGRGDELPEQVLRNPDDPAAALEHADAVTLPTDIYLPDLHYEYGEDDEHPAVTMSQYAARQYTQWLSHLSGRFYRLPTEAEWEYAARAGTKTAWSFGDDLEQLGRYAHYRDYPPGEEIESDDMGMLHAGTLKPNPWGLYDVHGNVANLVIDQYVEDHYAQLAARDQPVHFMDAVVWPTQPHPVVVRGGSWDHDAEDTRSAARWHTEEDWQFYDPDLPRSPLWYLDYSGPQMTGFRLVRPLSAPDPEVQHRFWASGQANLPDPTHQALIERLGRLFIIRMDDESIAWIKQRREKEAGDEE